MWVQLRRKFSREEFDNATILLLFEGGAEHLPVFREVCGFVLGTSGLVFAPDYRDFFTYEFFRGDCDEVPVIVWSIPNHVDISLDCFWIFVVAECAVDGFFPGVCKCPDVVECM